MNTIDGYSNGANFPRAKQWKNNKREETGKLYCVCVCVSMSVYMCVCVCQDTEAVSMSVCANVCVLCVIRGGWRRGWRREPGAEIVWEGGGGGGRCERVVRGGRGEKTCEATVERWGGVMPKRVRKRRADRKRERRCFSVLHFFWSRHSRRD